MMSFIMLSVTNKHVYNYALKQLNGRSPESNLNQKPYPITVCSILILP